MAACLNHPEIGLDAGGGQFLSIGIQIFAAHDISGSQYPVPIVQAAQHLDGRWAFDLRELHQRLIADIRVGYQVSRAEPLQQSYGGLDGVPLQGLHLLEVLVASTLRIDPAVANLQSEAAQHTAVELLDQLLPVEADLAYFGQLLPQMDVLHFRPIAGLPLLGGLPRQRSSLRLWLPASLGLG